MLRISIAAAILCAACSVLNTGREYEYELGRDGSVEMDAPGVDAPAVDAPRPDGAVTCTAPAADCDDDPTSCETNTQTDLDHCGGCNRPCGGPCVGGVCTPARPDFVAAGGATTCVRTDAQRIMCWGDNTHGQLGIGSTAPVEVATVIPGARVSMTASQPLAVGPNHTCAIDTLGQLFCWGANGIGQLGNGTSGPDSVRPEEVVAPPGAPVEGWTHVAAGGAGPTDAFTCGVIDGTSLYCWGHNDHGQLGNGTTTNASRPMPVSLSLPGTVDTLALGSAHACVLLSGSTPAGAVYCWGSSAVFANGHDDPKVDIVFPAGPVVTDGTTLAAGGGHTCASTDNRVRCWGWDAHLQLGDTTPLDTWMPQFVMTTGTPSGFGAQSLGGTSSYFIGDGILSAWGGNEDGQLARGAVGGPSGVPMNIDLPAGIVPQQVAAGDSHACALDAMSRLFCWGANGMRQVLPAGGGDTVVAPMEIGL